MKIGIATLARVEEGVEKRYNPQNYGLGIALEKTGVQVVIYSFEKRKTKEKKDKIGKNILVKHYSVRAFKNHSFAISKLIDTDLDALICFSDNQISFSSIYYFCKKYKIALYPYVGTLYSHNQSAILAGIMNIFAAQNMILYRHCIVFAKTKEVKNKLTAKKVLNTVLCPVGLMEECLKRDYAMYDKKLIKNSLGFEPECELILFVGRFVEEKRPNEMIHLFQNLYLKNSNLRLCMIGKGPLKNEVEETIDIYGLKKCIYLKEEVPNEEMWKYYLSCDCFVNLNMQEIFGMAILEAMYYERPVVAYAAPGPSTIISHSKDGFLFCNLTQAEEYIQNAVELKNMKEAHKTVIKYYMWDYSAKKMKETIYNEISKTDN